MGKPEIRFKGYTDEWEQRKLGELGSLKNGMNFSKEAMGIGFPFVNLQNIFGNNVIDVTNLGKAMASDSQLKDYNLLNGDVLFVRSSVKLEGVGEAALVPQNLENTTYSGFIIRFRDEYGLDNNFKRFIFGIESVRNQIMAQATNSANKNISQTVLENLCLKIPNKSEQEKIGLYFSNLDNLITLHQRKCDEVKSLKKYMLQKMFPQNEQKVPEIRFEGFTEVWEQRKLGDWGNFYYGRSCPKWSVTEDATIPCIRYGELYTKFGAKIDRVYSYTNMPPENLRFSKGTEVLIPRVGEDPMDYNHCTWLSMQDVAIGEMISVFNTDNNPLFTATMFNATLQNEFAMRVEGGSVTNLYFEKLKNIDVSFPSIPEQEKIAAYFENLDHLITLHQQKCEELKKIKKFMLQKMFV